MKPRSKVGLWIALGLLALIGLGRLLETDAEEVKMPEFIILMEEDDHAWGKLSPEEQEKLLKLYFAWVDQLRAKKIFKYGAPLGGEGRVLQVVEGAVVDGPFTETKEVLTGFFIIEAANLEAAVEIAQGCPALTHAERVVVRPVGHE